jgi:phage shock protein A
MIVAAQLRLGQLQVLERNMSKLEAENEDLSREVVQLRRESEARERDLSELEELRIHNEQLVRGVEALEGSRKQYETDAERYRQQADQSEKQSDTLRLKLADLEENFVAIEKQQDQVLKDAREASVVPILRKQR